MKSIEKFDLFNQNNKYSDIIDQYREKLDQIGSGNENNKNLNKLMIFDQIYEPSQHRLLKVPKYLEDAFGQNNLIKFIDKTKDLDINIKDLFKGKKSITDDEKNKLNIH